MQRIGNLGISGACIIEGDVRLERPVVMRSLIVGIVIMKLRTHLNWKLLIHMMFLAIKFRRLFVPCVIQNKMFSSTARTVESVLGSTSAAYADSLMMTTGGKENFFHCKTCGCCYSKLMKDGHRCIERAMHHSCPVCFEFLFDTTKDISVLPCGHTIHLECAKEMESHFQYSCPVCSKSICDMSRLWVKLDKVIASTPMPDIYKNKKVWILCNDCGAEGEVQFHVVAHKCLDCNSYNTKQTIGRRRTASCSSTTVPEIVS
ncbi:E3 ubiquitin-protein ligase MIEL1 isoform X2 [Cucumis melo var. makuwa]|uniref:E3 ubiquitin-protein ligase MIEL1 isoform X2 n=1 Tax=Cucumis melo var. makuwa TaxID=1194695 RepID=A0A5D3DKW5_CUCMM|nr:E3 ubiquitin-protein ligase MIEL1 isoform X2 [Cucumis melo var. makuwa]